MAIAIITLAIACSALTITVGTTGYFYFKATKQVNDAHKQIADLKIQIFREIELRNNAEQSLIDSTNDYKEEISRIENHVKLLKEQYNSLLKEMEQLEIPGAIRNSLNELFTSMIL